MKKHFFFLLFALMASTSMVFASDTQVDGIWYDFNSSSKTAAVTYQGSSSSNYSDEYKGEVVIPASVTYNDEEYSVTSISKNAFEECTGLTSVIIPNGVTDIGWYAFQNCSNLISVTIPKSIIEIGVDAFRGCSGLTSVYIDDISAWCGISFLKMGDVIVNNYYPSPYSNPFIYANNLYLKGELVSDLVIPNNVTTINDYAFYGCAGLSSVTIPSSITKIKKEAFRGCSGLTSVYIDDISAWCNIIFEKRLYNSKGYPFIPPYSNPICNANNLYLNGELVSDLIIPDNVTTINDYAFFNYNGLTSVNISNSVTRIGERAFQNCTGLTSVTIPSSVTSIGGYAFQSCSGLTSVTWNAKSCSDFSSSEYAPFYNSSQITSLTFGDEVEHIPAYFCYGMTNLTSVTIPNSIIGIGRGAFEGCSNLEVVYISDLEAWCGIEFGNRDANPLYYAHNLRSNNKKLTNIEIPNSVTNIGDWAFSGCSGLTSVTIPNSVTSIGSGAFFDCSGLTSVTIGNSVTSIGNDAFSNCSSLTSLTIPNSVTSIGDWVFCNCDGLTSVTIPNSVTSIGISAFRSCDGLTSVTIGNSVTSIGNDAFLYCSSLTSVVWNAKNCSRYNFGSQVKSFTFGDEVEVIPASICSGMNKLTSVTIPNSVTSIGDYAFNGCTGLTSVTIGNSVTSIGDKAFYGCSNITEVTWNAKHCSRYNFGSQVESFTFGDEVEVIPADLCSGMNKLNTVSIPNSVTSIGNSAFSGCYNIQKVYITNIGAWCNISFGDNSANPIYESSTSVILYLDSAILIDLVIPEGITKIPAYRFNRCTGITSIALPESLTSVENNAFNGCNNIRELTVPHFVPPTGWSKSGIKNTQCDLYVPGESVETYASSFWWEDFASIRAIGSKLVVKFQDWDGTELLSQEVEEGKAATPPADPAREGYTFTGWDKDYSNITENLIVTALYQINRLDVTFKDWDGTILKQQIVDWSTEATAPADPKREGYTFIGWDKDFSNIKEDIIVTAQYELGEKTNFIINFNAKDGENILHSEVVLTIPAAPVIEGFTFIGWRPVAELIETNVINIEAIYEADIPSSAPAVYTNPTNKAQKLIRENNVYILRGDKTYSITGQIVK